MSNTTDTSESPRCDDCKATSEAIGPLIPVYLHRNPSVVYGGTPNAPLDGYAKLCRPCFETRREQLDSWGAGYRRA